VKAVVMAVRGRGRMLGSSSTLADPVVMAVRGSGKMLATSSISADAVGVAVDATGKGRVTSGKVNTADEMERSRPRLEPAGILISGRTVNSGRRSMEEVSVAIVPEVLRMSLAGESTSSTMEATGSRTSSIMVADAVSISSGLLQWASTYESAVQGAEAEHGPSQ
jgi:hypothetical protein